MIAWLAGVVLAAGLTGCGGNDPCPVPEAMVDTARGARDQAQRAADELTTRQESIENEIQRNKDRLRELEERKQRLESELAEFAG